MYYADYNDGTYTTQKYITEKEAIDDMCAYMELNGISDEFTVYYMAHIDAKSIINPICEADILQLIKDYTIGEYGEEAKDYLKTMDIEAYKYFRYALNEYKKALTSWLKNYNLEPTWEHKTEEFIYQYDADKKVWKFIRQVV